MMTEEQKQDMKAQIREIFMRNGFTIKDGQSDLKDYVFSAAYELIAALTQPASPSLKLPDGWVAVPLEPTEEMIAAWRDDMDKSYAKEHAIKIGEDEIVFAHQAMLSAAPSVPHTAPIEPICATGGAESIATSGYSCWSSIMGGDGWQ